MLARCGIIWHYFAMPKRPDFLPIPDAKRGFMVSIPAAMTGHGKRERRFFKDPKDAERFAAGLRGQYARGERGGIVDAGLARMASEAAKVAPEGTSILEAVKAYAKMVAIVAPFGISPLDACKAIAEQNRASGTAETFRERYDRFCRENETRWRPRYANDMGKIPKWIGDELMATHCAGVNDAVIEAALRKNGAGAASTVTARKTRVLAVLHAKAKKHRSSAVVIMTPRQCGKMLRACQTPAERWAVALLLFAGVRPYAEGGNGELGRLDWSDIGKKHITVHPEASKTGTDRFIPITGRLRRLLRGHPTSGTVIPPNWQRRIQAIRKAAGIAGEQDATRHTFASNYVAAFGIDAGKAAMGHTQNSQTLIRHYLRAVTSDAGKHYFR
jgi:integrase